MSASAFDPSRPFTRADGLAAGLTPARLRSTAFLQLNRNVYVSRSTQATTLVRAQAVALIAPSHAVVSHHTAAVLWGGVVPTSSEVHVTVRRRDSFQVEGVRTHRSDRRRAVVRWRGVTVTTPEQTLVDLSGRLDLLGLVVLGDSLIARGRSTCDDLLAFALTWPGAHRRLAQRAAALVRVGVDSAPETRLRLLMVLAGLPEPEVNHVIRDPVTGEWKRRFELAYPEIRLAVEYEGRHHRQDDVWAADIERREELDRRGWRVVQVVSDGLYNSPLRTLQRIEQARRDRGAPALARFADEWKRYFLGRVAA